MISWGNSRRQQYLPGGESEHHDSLPRLSGLARYRFVTIAWFGSCAMRKGEVLFVRLLQESSFSPPVD